MSTTPADDSSSALFNIVLNEKQERVRVCLTACLKTPTKFDLELRPGGKCRFAATFDKTAAGVKFGKVDASSDQITVPAEIDLTTVEVDFERLAYSTGLESAEDAEEIWESIKSLVQPGPSITTIFETVNGARTISRESSLLKRSKRACRPPGTLPINRKPDQTFTQRKGPDLRLRVNRRNHEGDHCIDQPVQNGHSGGLTKADTGLPSSHMAK